MAWSLGFGGDSDIRVSRDAWSDCAKSGDYQCVDSMIKKQQDTVEHIYETQVLLRSVLTTVVALLLTIPTMGVSDAVLPSFLGTELTPEGSAIMAARLGIGTESSTTIATQAANEEAEIDAMEISKGPRTI